MEFQDQQDQKGREAIKGILVYRDQLDQQGHLVLLVKREAGGKGGRKALGGLKGIRETKERLD